MPTRRLAAIMFTDIEGYTRLMEEDEAYAQILRKRHREVFEHFHQEQKGKIIQYFGDGTLSIFDSCVEAVKCAVAMQKAFQESPKVPLRVGIHLGDIEYSQTEVIGSGVNIAARVESLGVSGAILVSEGVNHQIKNHGFESISMGTFEMKNVSRNIEVFAIQTQDQILPIPDPKSLKGKGKRLDGILKTRQVLKLASIGFVAMLIGAALFWASGAGERSQLLPDSVREEKVAVNVFENHTRDATLDALGYLSSEWINSGLRELKIKTVSPELIRQNKEKVGILPNNPEGKPSFAEITGAKYMVSGSYFLQGDSIVLNTRLSSTETGEDIHHFPSLKGHKNRKEDLIHEAREYLMGYWVVKKDQFIPMVRPPKYEAYQAYLDQLETTIDWGEKAIKIDPEFFIARNMQLYLAVILDDDSMFHEHRTILEAQWRQRTEYEKNHVRESVALWEGNYQAAFEAMDANYRLHPKDWHTLHESGFVASRGLNRLDIAIERYEKIFDHLEYYENEIIHHTFNNYLNALNRNKDHQKVIDLYQSLSEKMKEKMGRAIREVILAYIYLDEIEAAKKLLNEPIRVLQATYAHAYIYPNASFNPFAQDLQKHLDSFEDPSIKYLRIGQSYINWYSKAMAYYVLEEWEEAERTLIDLRGIDWEAFMQNPLHPNQYELWVESMLGCIYAQQGKQDAALKQIALIEKLGDQFHNNHHSHFMRGEIPYLISRVYACLDEKEKASEYLQTAIDQGRTYERWNITFDLFLVNLKGYPPFEALVAPKH